MATVRKFTCPVIYVLRLQGTKHFLDGMVLLHLLALPPNSSKLINLEKIAWVIGASSKHVGEALHRLQDLKIIHLFRQGRCRYFSFVDFENEGHHS